MTQADPLTADGIGGLSPRPNRMNWRSIVASSVGLIICTNGPSTYLSLRVFNHGGGVHAWLSLYPFSAVAVAGAVLMWRSAKGNGAGRMPFVFWAVLGYVGFALLSAFWSVSSQTTSTQAIIGVGIAGFGCWFGWCLNVAEQIASVAAACSVVVVSSALVVWFLPQYGKMFPDTVPDRYWQGIFANRNSLAPICVLGLIALAGLVASRPTVRILVLVAPLVILHGIMLRASGGATSLAALGIATVIGLLVPLVRLLRRTGVPGAAVGSVAVLGASASILWGFRNMDRLATWLSRDVTFTGRRPIWRDVRGFIRVHPIRGYGFWAFWDRADLTSASYARLNSAYGSAHNSVLEVMLGLGVIGVVIFLMIVFSSIVGIASSVWSRTTIGPWWWAMVLSCVIIQNLMESFVLWHSYLWVLLLASAMVPFHRSDRIDTDEQIPATGPAPVAFPDSVLDQERAPLCADSAAMGT